MIRFKILKNIFIALLLTGIFTLNLFAQNTFESNILTSEDTVKSLKFLSAQISKVITNANFKNTKYTIAVYSLDNNKYYFKKSTNRELTPASLTKLFVCYSALMNLGKDYQYKTEIYHSGTFKNGIINGDIYIIGAGDPLFSTDDLKAMIDSMHSYGIKEIKGDIIADANFFDNITDRLKYSGDKDRVQGLPPITGLSINKNIVTITVKGIPQGKLRKPVVVTDPPSPSFKIINKAKVKGRPKHKNTKKQQKRSYIEPMDNITIYGGPVVVSSTARRRSSIRIRHKKDASGKQIFTVTGTINADNSYSYSYFISDPVQAVSGALLKMLNRSNIKVHGTFKKGNLNDVTTPIYKIAEADRFLLDVISPTLKNSDNFNAEHIFKLIGAANGKMVENAKESRQIIVKTLDSLGIDFSNCVFYDGSGLSRRNKLTSKVAIEFLSVLFNSEYRPILDTTLAIAGVDGTLKKRMKYSLAQNNLRAKTGTHKNVSGLCGTVKTLDGENLAFCFIFNGPSVGLYKQVENRLGIILAEFFYFNRES